MNLYFIYFLYLIALAHLYCSFVFYSPLTNEPRAFEINESALNFFGKNHQKVWNQFNFFSFLRSVTYLFNDNQIK